MLVGAGVGTMNLRFRCGLLRGVRDKTGGLFHRLIETK